MAEVTREQMREFLAQWAAGRVTREAFQELLDRGPKLGYARLCRQVLETARQLALKHGPQTLRLVAETYAGIDDLASAEKVAGEIRSSYEREQALGAIGTAHVSNLNFALALRTVAVVSAAYVKNKLLEATALGLAEVGEFAGALRAAERIDSEEGRMEAITDIVCIQAPLDYAGARNTTNEITNWPLRAKALAAIAESSRTADDLPPLREAIERIEPGRPRFEALLTIACITGAPDDVVAVERAVLEEDKYPVDRARQLLDLAPKLQASEAFIEIARRVVTGEREGGWQTCLAIEIAGYTRRTEDIEKARACVIGGKNRPYVRAHRLIDLYLISQDVRDICEARSIAQEIPEGVDRGWAFRAIAAATDQEDDLEAARLTAESVKEETNRAKLLADIGRISRSPRDFDAACEAAEKITDSKERIETLCYIARILADAA